LPSKEKPENTVAITIIEKNFLILIIEPPLIVVLLI